MIDIEISQPSHEDYEEYRKCGMRESCLDGKIKLICRDIEGHEAISFMTPEMLDRLGLEYIKGHGILEYVKFCDQWFLQCSEDDFYNDQSRNPDTEIVLAFDGIEDTTGREVYRDDDGRYYLREVSRREPFAKWYRCGKRRRPDDGDEARPNTIFRFKNQIEKVVYHDWNGTAAYSGQFNPNFRMNGKQSKI